MIAVDTSALMSILQQEPSAAACAEALGEHTDLVISAVTLAEALVVAGRRGIGAHVRRLMESLPLMVIEATGETATRVDAIYARWGKGAHPAKLNIVDCFAYEVATAYDCPLLFIGDDFSQTDVKRAIQN